MPLVRAALWVLPFRIVSKQVARRIAHGPRTTEHGPRVETITWSVKAVAARVPRASCLTQALAASLLLARYGHAATLRVGVAKDEGGSLRAHAWLERDGAAILGEPAPGAFHAMPPLVLS